MGQINEVFYSLQGEQPGLGEPSIFVRTSGCDRACDFCDSKYSWGKGDEMTVLQLFKKIESISKRNRCEMNKCKTVIITGGEPTIQMNFLKDLLFKLKGENYIVNLETNGTGYSSWFSSFDRICVSPKDMLEDTRDACYQLKSLNNSYFKLIHTYMKQDSLLQMITYLELPVEKVYIMTEAANQKELRLRLQHTWDFCMKHGLNMGYRLQIEIFDKRRGV